MTDVFLHLIQPKFRSIFGEHYYRYFCRIVEIFLYIFSLVSSKSCVAANKSKIKMLRTVISSLYCTSSDDSMVVQAYVLLDPNKENLYFRQELLPKIKNKNIFKEML